MSELHIWESKKGHRITYTKFTKTYFPLKIKATKIMAQYDNTNILLPPNYQRKNNATNGTV